MNAYHVSPPSRNLVSVLKDVAIRVRLTVSRLQNRRRSLNLEQDSASVPESIFPPRYKSVIEDESSCQWTAINNANNCRERVFGKKGRVGNGERERERER